MGKNKIRLFLVIAFTLISISSFAQNIRGFYLQDVGTWLGNATKENEILTYAQGNGFNYILFYDLGQISWTSTTEKNQLGAFISKARTQYGILQVGGVVEYAGYASQKIIPYNISRTSALEKFDVINMELEFWVNSSISSSYCSKFLSPGGFSCDSAGAFQFAWREFKLIDDLCAANGMISEYYLGWPNKGQMQQLASRADRLLLASYRPTDADIYTWAKNRMKDISTIGGTTKVLTLLSSEPNFMQSWLNSHPQTQPYQTFDAALAAEPLPFKQNIDLQGYQWFTYKHMPKTIIATATISAGGPLTFCPGGSVTLTANSGASYLWIPGGQTTQSITATAVGSYSVIVTSASGAAITSAPVVVSHSQATAPLITAAGSTSFCAGGSVILTANNAPSYTWSNGETTQSITVTTAGTFSVTTGGACGGTSAPIVTNIVTTPPVPVITASSSLNICPGSILTLTCSPANGYLWSNGATTRTIAISAAGNYSVIAYSGPNCSASSSASAVTLLPAPAVPTITANGSTTLSAAQPNVILTSTSANSYLWNTSEVTNAITVSTQGNYRVTVSGSNGCTATSNDIIVIANGCTPPPAPVITLSGPPVVSSGQPITLTSTVCNGYLWSTGETTQSIVVTTAGSYTVRSYIAGGCYSTSLPATITVILSNESNASMTADEKLALNIFPNPASSELNVVFNTTSKNNIAFKLLDVTGREIYSREINPTSGENRLQVDVSALPKGIYVGYLLGEDIKEVKKVVIE